MKNKIVGFTLVELLVFISVMGILAATVIPAVINYTKTGRGAWNNQMYGVQKVDDHTRYSTRKHVEDQCRAMMAEYRGDISNIKTYEKGGNLEWAMQLKVRANRTAAVYNEYVLKNSFVWNGNIPSDIMRELPYVE